MNKLTKFLLPSLLIFPVIASAKTIADMIGQAKVIMNAVIPFLVALAVFFFIWNVFVYVTKAGDEAARTEARGYIIYSLIGIFCMLSVWGLLNILTESIKLDTGGPTYPTI